MKFGKFLPCSNNQFWLFRGLLSALSTMKINANFSLSSHTTMVNLLTVGISYQFFKTVIASNVKCLTQAEDLIS